MKFMFHFLEWSVIRTWAHRVYMSVAAFVEKWQHSTIVAEAKFSTELTAFTVWPYTGKVYNHLA